MKITGTGGTPSASTSRPAARTGAGFSLPASSSAAPAAAASASSAAAGVAGLSALMTLQGVDDPAERRRRAIRRGSGLLDRLEELKLALLEGGDPSTVLQQLSRNAAEERPAEEDPGLKAVLDQIDLRAAVELAKLEVAKRSVR